MSDNYEINHLDLTLKHNYEEWLNLLKQEGVAGYSTVDLSEIDYCFGIHLDDELIATASTYNNIIKYVVIKESKREGGKVFNKLISHLITDLASRNIFHIFVFTSPSYCKSFQYLGFLELASTDLGSLLETGDQNIKTYLADIKKAKTKKNAAIVMNANPFTKGHYHLVKTAAEENDTVYVFVVSADKSLFTAQERFELVKAGVKDLDNVIVNEASDYQVSPITFPTYFLKREEDITTFQTELDATLFKKWFVPALHIKTRYLGEEPYSKVTRDYNEALVKVLEPQVKVKIIPRLKKNGEFISATKVREMIKRKKWGKLKDFVGEPTLEFILNHKKELLRRAGKKEK
jgi:[citrate (pro-3S)-lyase] ligase